MSGRIYDPKLMEKAAQTWPGRGLIEKPNVLPKELQAKEILTLDQIDARQVRVEVATKKSYRVPRVKITNKTITLLLGPRFPAAATKDLLLMAVEARRRLRHPDNQPHATPLTGIAYGKLEVEPEQMEEILKRGSLDTGGSIPTILSVTLGGKPATVVRLEDIQKKENENGKEGDGNPADDQLHHRLVHPGRV